MAAKNRRNRNKGSRRNRAPKRLHDGAAFWGDDRPLPGGDQRVQMTTDPAAVPRSLGPPPLPGHEAIAAHYFAAVYDRAVTTAGALAAAGGLIDHDAIDDES